MKWQDWMASSLINLGMVPINIHLYKIAHVRQTWYYHYEAQINHSASHSANIIQLDFCQKFHLYGAALGIKYYIKWISSINKIKIRQWWSKKLIVYKNFHMTECQWGSSEIQFNIRIFFTSDQKFKIQTCWLKVQFGNQKHSEGMVSACKDRSVPHHLLAHLQVISGHKETRSCLENAFQKEPRKGLVSHVFYHVGTHLIA